VQTVTADNPRRLASEPVFSFLLWPSGSKFTAEVICAGTGAAAVHRSARLDSKVALFMFGGNGIRPVGKSPAVATITITRARGHAPDVMGDSTPCAFTALVGSPAPRPACRRMPDSARMDFISSKGDQLLDTAARSGGNSPWA
jgi:hypothetical protein